MAKDTTIIHELARLERRMERRWYDLAMAEQHGQPMPVLERMYEVYLSALDAYIAYQRRIGGEGPSRGGLPSGGGSAAGRLAS